MRIRHISIRNFRGIRELDWALPDKPLLCLVGRGDSTKSTVLEAVRRTFHPQWNLAFDDADFYQCLPENAISIEVTLGELTDQLRDLEAYGHWLSGWDPEAKRWHNEPGGEREDALRIRLSVGPDLEPSWRVIKAANDEGTPFRPTDREKIGVQLISGTSDRHLTWSRGSLLGHLTEDENLPHSLVEAGRAAKRSLEKNRQSALTKFDEVAEKAEKIARSLGVRVASSYKAQLDSESISVRIGGLAIHDGEMPLRQLGLGSKRVLTAGLQKQTLHSGHITLFDEVEIGLEPHRIARLLQNLKEDATGQYFLTTHSPVALRELTVEDLHIVHSRCGKTEIVPVNPPPIAELIQGKIRAGAEAFLAPKIVVCEGATEVGFLRALDGYWATCGMPSFAYQGVGLFDAKGARTIRGVAGSLAQLSYSVAVLADSDAPDQFSSQDAAYLREKGITVALWDGNTCIEEQVFADIPWPYVRLSLDTAAGHYGCRAVIDQVQSKYGEGFSRDPSTWTDNPKIREALAKAANSCKWFKSISLAQTWAGAVCPCLSDPSMQGSDLAKKLAAIRDWVDDA